MRRADLASEREPTQTLSLLQFGLAMLRGPQIQDWRQEAHFEVEDRGVPLQRRSAEIIEHRDVVGPRGQPLEIPNTTRRGRGFGGHINEEKLLVTLKKVMFLDKEQCKRFQEMKLPFSAEQSLGKRRELKANPAMLIPRVWGWAVRVGGQGTHSHRDEGGRR